MALHGVVTGPKLGSLLISCTQVKRSAPQSEGSRRIPAINYHGGACDKCCNSEGSDSRSPVSAVQLWRLEKERKAGLVATPRGLRGSTAVVSVRSLDGVWCGGQRWRGSRGGSVLASGQSGVGGSALVEGDELVKKSDQFFKDDLRPIILFDGVCNLCNGGVNFMLANDSAGKARFAALQSEAGRALLARSGRSPEDISSIVLVEKDQSYVKSDAILRIGQLLALPLQVLATLAFVAPLPLRDTVYNLVADNRYNVLGIRSECRLSDARFEERFVQ